MDYLAISFFEWSAEDNANRHNQEKYVEWLSCAL